MLYVSNGGPTKIQCRPSMFNENFNEDSKENFKKEGLKEDLKYRPLDRIY